jgi:hypothetical protein
MTDKMFWTKLLLALSICAMTLAACGARRDEVPRPAASPTGTVPASESDLVLAETQRLLEELGRMLKTADTFEDLGDSLP